MMVKNNTHTFIMYMKDSKTAVLVCASDVQLL